MKGKGPLVKRKGAVNFLLSFYFSPEDHVVEARALVAWFFLSLKDPEMCTPTPVGECRHYARAVL